MAAARTEADVDRSSDGKFTHGCGEKFTHAAWYTKHAMKCDGKPVQTRGRIERLAGRAGRALVPVSTGGRPRKTDGDEKTERRRAQYRASAERRRNGEVVDRTPPAAAVVAIAAAATDKATEIVIAGLMQKRELIDRAIAALQAVG